MSGGWRCAPRCWIVLLGGVLMGACSDPDSHDHPASSAGEDFYREHCAECHLDSGKGLFLKGVPPALYMSLDVAAFTDRILGHSRDEGSRMPLFASMPRAEAAAIADYLQQRLRAASSSP